MDPYEFDTQYIPSGTNPSLFLMAGVDEVGRGPLAGPVVAAAVILPQNPTLYGLADSKALTAEQREASFCEITETAVDYAISIVEPDKIDAINILQASLLAMRTAVKQLETLPQLVLLDGNQHANCGLPEKTIIKGDGKSAAIMAASIVAKVTRDAIMEDAHQIYPQYGFDRHKGYGSAFHLAALKAHGSCYIHRKSFGPVKNLISH